MAYDIIGDIHGQVDKLTALLAKLGYRKRAGAYRHPECRTAVFLGDLIDRGPGQLETIEIVRGMLDAGTGQCVMGNHELNAIGYATPDLAAGSNYLRPHTKKNIDQHAEFLSQVGEGSPLHSELVRWFITLPPFLDLGGMRVVHAWWYQPHIETVLAATIGRSSLSQEFLHAAFRPGTSEYDAMEGLTKGIEIDLPEGCRFTDHSGVERRKTRARWWRTDARTYRDLAILPAGQELDAPDSPVPVTLELLPVPTVPTFVGHYWLTGAPEKQAPMVACLDYSAAGGGPLVAYRWDGESELLDSGFVAAG